MASNNFKNLKILVVEDQPDVREIIKGILMGLGVAKIFEAENGSDAIAMLRSVDDFADMVVCDWNMPEMSGLDVLQEVRTIHPEMPFLMVTGRDDFASVSEAKEKGVTAYIRKPLSSEQLESKIRIMRKRRKTDAA